MQQAALKAAFASDLLLLSPTGSGKTLAFLLPVLKVLDVQSSGIQVLILVPSRELALQIEQVFKQMQTGFKVNCCYGGHATKIEKNNLQHAPAVLIGTPGRIAYHLREENFKPQTIQTLILDEFDKSLEFGFEADMSYIIGSLTNLKRRILTSASRIAQIPAFTGINQAVELDFLKDSSQSPSLTVKALKADAASKHEVLFSLLCKIGNSPALVFCNHRDAVDRISNFLYRNGLEHGVFHGGMEQEDRERALLKFRNGSYHLLITTDLASRGLDIPQIEYVIHYQLPHTEEAFLHRNGRTARMKATGTSYLIIAEDEKPAYIKQLPDFEELSGQDILPKKSSWVTLYLAAGKKDKINKIDIVGLLLQKGGLQKDELGLIEVQDFASYAAVKQDKAVRVLYLLKNEKIKNKKIKIEVSK